MVGLLVGIVSGVCCLGVFTLVMWKLGVTSIIFRLIQYGGTGCGVGATTHRTKAQQALWC